jgi:arylformamidase
VISQNEISHRDCLAMNTKYVYLSHPIGEQTPLYGGQSCIRIKKDLQISAGDVANSLLIEIPNHASTHIDLPRHFSNSGKSLSDYQPDFWFFHNVCVLKIDAMPGDIIDLRPYLNEVLGKSDLLLLKTGFQKHRSERMYWEQNPGVSPESAGELRRRCADLKAVGMDFISVSSFQKPDIGNKAHTAFLIENDIILIEDMNLASVDSQLLRVYILPILIEGADGGPVTAVGELQA